MNIPKHMQSLCVNWIKTPCKLQKVYSYLMVKCQSMILEKIVYMVFSSKSLIVIMLKWRRYRGVTGFRPPPKRQQQEKLNSYTQTTPLKCMLQLSFLGTQYSVFDGILLWPAVCFCVYFMSQWSKYNIPSSCNTLIHDLLTFGSIISVLKINRANDHGIC